jgi:hypothetical protein
MNTQSNISLKINNEYNNYVIDIIENNPIDYFSKFEINDNNELLTKVKKYIKNNIHEDVYIKYNDYINNMLNLNINLETFRLLFLEHIDTDLYELEDRSIIYSYYQFLKNGIVKEMIFSDNELLNLIEHFKKVI